MISVIKFTMRILACILLSIIPLLPIGFQITKNLGPTLLQGKEVTRWVANQNGGGEWIKYIDYTCLEVSFVLFGTLIVIASIALILGSFTIEESK